MIIIYIAKPLFFHSQQCCHCLFLPLPIKIIFFHNSVTGYASHPDSYFFVPRIKGECEEFLKNLELSRLVIYRPGLLRCQRNETRMLESMARSISNWIDYQRNWWSISTDDLAAVMIHQFKKYFNQLEEPKVVILEHSEIVQVLKDQ